MLGELFDAIFGCWHTRYSFPLSLRSGCRGSKAACLTGIYVVCLNCGREFPYDWAEMKVIFPRSEKAWMVASVARQKTISGDPGERMMIKASVQSRVPVDIRRCLLISCVLLGGCVNAVAQQSPLAGRSTAADSKLSAPFHTE